MKMQWMYGYHAVYAALLHRPQAIHKLMLTDNMTKQATLQAVLKMHNFQYKIALPSHITELIGTEKHQGIAAFITDNEPIDLQEFLALYPPVSPWTVVVLDRVQDPHNLGACIRSALAFGAKGVIVPKHQAVGLTPVVKKSACGAADILPFIQVNNLGQGLNSLREEGVWCIGLAGEAKYSLSDAALTRPCAIIMGAEGEGLRQKTRTLCDELVSIPMSDAMPSLNVSVALGVSLYAWHQANATSLFKVT